MIKNEINSSEGNKRDWVYTDSTLSVRQPFWFQPESRRLEFKEAWPKGDQFSRTAVAFANGAGGKIVFGVRNAPREIIGISDKDIFSLEERAANHILIAL